MLLTEIENILGQEIEELLDHKCRTIDKSDLYLPSESFIEDVLSDSSRNNKVLNNLSRLFNSGNLAGTGYLSILPVDQGVEHSAGSAFSENPMYFDPKNILDLAIEGGCNAVATTFGNFGAIARKYSHKIPFIVKINHNETLTIPSTSDQVLFGSVREAWNMGAAAIGATIYFCSEESNRQIREVSQAFELAHELGMATILWCYPRNKSFKTEYKDHHLSADVTGQCNYLGSTIQADIVKQKLPLHNRAFEELKYSHYNDKMYDHISSTHLIDLCRYQVLNCLMGRIGLINSGGASQKQSDLKDVLRTAIINKRAGGMGLISGRKAFQKPFAEGVSLLQAIQSIYLNKEITIA